MKIKSQKNSKFQLHFVKIQRRKAARGAGSPPPPPRLDRVIQISYITLHKCLGA